MKIRFYYENVKFRIRKSKEIKILIEKVVRCERKIPVDLIFIFTNDKRIREINSEFLKHDYFTDVITFDYSEGRKIKGEVYISIETVKRNAINYKVSLKEEVGRVVIHGTLHLCGWNDIGKSNRERIRKEEEKWMERFRKR